jgi:hypothetical protein
VGGVRDGLPGSGGGGVMAVAVWALCVLALLLSALAMVVLVAGS